MSTSNFHNVNASKIFAFSPSSDAEDEEVDYFIAQENYEWNLEGITDNLQEVGKKKGFWFRSKEGNDPDELRSYPSSVIGTLSKDKEYYLPKYGNISVRVSVVCIRRSAYYDGVNYDWNVEYLIEGSEVDSLGGIVESLEYLSYPKGCHSALEAKAKWIRTWFEKTKNELATIVESIYEKSTTPLHVVARFSNGETLYSK